MSNVSAFIAKHGVEAFFDWVNRNYIRRNTYFPEEKYENVPPLTSTLTVLNYSEGTSKTDPMALECRCLKLRIDADGSVHIESAALNRFLNEGDEENEEVPVFNPDTHIVFEKLDGSIIIIYWCEASGRWEISTRTMAFAEGHVSGQTFSYRQGVLNTLGVTEEMWQAWASVYLNKNLTYVCEWISPQNRVLTEYKDDQLVLLAVRNNYGTFRERSWPRVRQIFYDTFHRFNTRCRTRKEYSVFQRQPCRLPRVYNYTNNDDIHKSITLMKEDKDLFEGFVIFDTVSGLRYKVKNPHYLWAHKYLGQFTDERRLQLVLNNLTAEYLQAFPQEEKEIARVSDTFNMMYSDILLEYNKYLGKPMREFGQEISAHRYSSLLFSLLKGNAKTRRDVVMFYSKLKPDIQYSMFSKYVSSRV